LQRVVRFEDRWAGLIVKPSTFRVELPPPSRLMASVQPRRFMMSLSSRGFCAIALGLTALDTGQARCRRSLVLPSAVRGCSLKGEDVLELLCLPIHHRSAVPQEDRTAADGLGLVRPIEAVDLILTLTSWPEEIPFNRGALTPEATSATWSDLSSIASSSVVML